VSPPYHGHYLGIVRVLALEGQVIGHLRHVHQPVACKPLHAHEEPEGAHAYHAPFLHRHEGGGLCCAAPRAPAATVTATATAVAAAPVAAGWARGGRVASGSCGIVREAARVSPCALPSLECIARPGAATAAAAAAAAPAVTFPAAAAR